MPKRDATFTFHTCHVLQRSKLNKNKNKNDKINKDKINKDVNDK